MPSAAARPGLMTTLSTVAVLPTPSAAERNGATPGYTAVIDIGSGSARAVIMQVNAGGGIEIVAQQRVNLNLMSHVGVDGVLNAAGVAGTLEALDDFALLAGGYGIRAIHAVGTAALRESGNAAAITGAAAERFGIPLRIIDGDDEAAYCFIGAIHGLPVADGLLADIGGGSTEIVRFADRTLRAADSLPVGSLRIANRFGLTDRPSAAGLQDAYAYVGEILAGAGVPRRPDAYQSERASAASAATTTARTATRALVGSGGSVRLLARLARTREEIYPIIRMHGYEIDAGALAALVRTLAGLSRQERAGMAGMNPERAHSIVGGAVIAHALAQCTGAGSLIVSGQGLREGLARRPETRPLPAAGQIGLPALDAVRKTATQDLAQRFAPRYSGRGRRRAELAGRIAAAAWPHQRSGLDGTGPDADGGAAAFSAAMTDALQCAAFLLDIGDAVDFYNRANRTASIIVRTDLPGYTHREAARIAAILLASESGRLPRRFRRSRLLSRQEVRLIDQAALMLELADRLDSRLPLGRPAATVQIERKSGMLTIETPGWSPVAAPELAARWQETFGEAISIARGE